MEQVSHRPADGDVAAAVLPDGDVRDPLLGRHPQRPPLQEAAEGGGRGRLRGRGGRGREGHGGGGRRAKGKERRKERGEIRRRERKER